VSMGVIVCAGAATGAAADLTAGGIVSRHPARAAVPRARAAATDSGPVSGEMAAICDAPHTAGTRVEARL